ncbi:dGTPase [Citrobacter portucalensis]|uniref:dGTPase n=1 Tax=Citrobacter portucalensis TaxID=1639133 RepID=UPI001373F3AC|nr:dGTPase [Citrobacter portucalensis]MCR3700195.1 dGTPase [Citrobacter portucalensis]BBV14849.1 deoxyguanosinetriphosphate triphosphohydrolase [Citrobacter portucalensis]
MLKFIKNERHRQSSADHTTLLAATQSDRARLIYSAAFRRLQQKAQVFSLENNSSVRSRLTHSIEVSHIGRYIVGAIFEKITESNNFSDEVKNDWAKYNLAISNIVETACLMHDIGNPPFGHFGEAAIINWSKSDKIKEAINKSLIVKLTDPDLDVLLCDFQNFDGNPQGFRVITRLQGEDGFYGLNLTYTQLVVFLKYTCCPANKNKDNPFNKKIGYFSTERDIIESAWENLGIPYNSRHPLGFLMEASDDISYCISDIEDGLEKRIIIFDDFKKFTIKQLSHIKIDFPHENKICDDLIERLSKKDNSPIGNFLSFKTKLSNFLVDRVSSRFVYHYDRFVRFEYNSELISDDDFEFQLLKILKDYTSKFLFTSAEAEMMELSGFSIIKGILDEYLKLLSLSKEDFSILVKKDNKNIRKKDLDIQRRLYNRLPSKHISAYKTSLLGVPTNHPDYSDEKVSAKLESIDEKKELTLRVHLIVDFVSGMTDPFAMDMYQMLKGIKVM